jgi:16S rRNA processing protein RimM
LSNEPEREPEASAPEQDDIVIGKVISVNVPRRELRIAPDTSHPERFHSLHRLRLRTKDDKTLMLPIDSVRVTHKGAIVRVKSNDADEIAAARGAKVLVSRSERFPLPRHEYYIDDLIGLVVKDTTGRLIGRIKEVWQTAANDVYQVLDEAGRETLLPAIEDVIITVDTERGELIADTSFLE